MVQLWDSQADTWVIKSLSYKLKTFLKSFPYTYLQSIPLHAENRIRDAWGWGG